MEYLIGVALALAVAAGSIWIGFTRDRAFNSAVLIAVATYYVLFAAIDPSRRALAAEIAVACAFILAAGLGFKGNPQIVAAAIFLHGLFDVVHHRVIDNPGMPLWWPGFCMAFDVVFGAIFVVRLRRLPI